MSHEYQQPSFEKKDEPAGYGPGPGQYPSGGYGTAGQTPSYPPAPQYGQHGQQYYPPARPTNTFAVLALVLSFVFAPLGIVFGVLARRQIRVSGESGDGLAKAGLIIGIVFSSIYALYILIALASVFFSALAVSASS